MCHTNLKTEWLLQPEPLKYNIQGAYMGYPKLCDICYDVLIGEYTVMCLIFIRLKTHISKDVKHLLLKYLTKDR